MVLDATEAVNGQPKNSKMNSKRAYAEVADFIAANNPLAVIAFKPSAESKGRVADFISREKTEGLSSDEKSELDHYMMIEHLMRLAKARAQRSVSSDLDRISEVQ